MSKSYATDENGRITQIDSTHERSDGKTETVHMTRDGIVTGKTVNNPETGTSEHYDRVGGGPLFGFIYSK